MKYEHVVAVFEYEFIYIIVITMVITDSVCDNSGVIFV